MKVEHLADKSEWPDGPWKTEPDQLEWVDPETGYECLISRSSTTGALNGYVNVPYGHPCYGKHYDEVEIAVHGGLTYGGAKPQGDADQWWLGFDCAHFNDYTPLLEVMLRRGDVHLPPNVLNPAERYKPIKYVVEQCTLLAAYLKVMEPIQ